MTPPPSLPPRRGFFLPMLGIVFLFVALGPAVGAAVFIPLALLAEAGTQAAAHIGWIAGLVGHAFALIPAYVLGLAPAALAGLVYALYDAWAPTFAPRVLGAALIGAVFAHGFYLWVLWAGAEMNVWVQSDFGSDLGEMITDWTSGEFDVSLYRALLAGGAAAGFVCALVANALRLTSRI